MTEAWARAASFGFGTGVIAYATPRPISPRIPSESRVSRMRRPQRGRPLRRWERDSARLRGLAEDLPRRVSVGAAERRERALMVSVLLPAGLQMNWTSPDSRHGGGADDRGRVSRPRRWEHLIEYGGSVRLSPTTSVTP